jgi:predicted DNA-binding transcriptional regulator YafY
MPKKTHSYTEPQAFERLLLLISTLLKNPGVGSSDNTDTETNEHHKALNDVQLRLQELAQSLGIELPKNYPAIPTLRKDLETLRKYGILDRRMYRWGYYLGTAAMSQEELKVAVNALASQAQFQRHPQIRKIYATLKKRLRGLDLELKGEFFYPVRQHLNRAIIYTDPEEMANLGKYRNTLFHQIPIVEKAIILGQAIEISRISDPYGKGNIGMQQVYPLQLIYHDIAWYLLYEYCHNGHLVISRLNRLANHCEILKEIPFGETPRTLEIQNQSLAKAYQLLENGWGLNLGYPEEQKQELTGELELIEVKIRFFPPATTFIIEGERRHKKQHLKYGERDANGTVNYVDYTVPLPPRSLDECMLWVHRYMDGAQVLSPKKLVEKQHERAINLLARYQ